MRSSGRIPKTDFVYAGLFVALVALLAVFALLGSSFAALALPFALGGAAGYAVARLVASSRAPRWAQAAAVLSAAAALAMGCLMLVLPFANHELARYLPGLDLSGSGTFLGRLAFGFGFVYLEEVFWRASFPSLFPRTPEEADRQSREWTRGALIVGGVFLGLAVLAAIVFGALALIVYLVAKLSG